MQHNINTILAGFIIVMCFVLAYFFVCTDLMRETLRGTKRTVFVAVLLVYGTYRSYRLYKIIKAQRHENEN